MEYKVKLTASQVVSLLEGDQTEVEAVVEDLVTQAIGTFYPSDETKQWLIDRAREEEEKEVK